MKPIETTYKQFFKGEGGLPQFHAKYARPESFPLCAGAFRIKGRHLHIAKIGEVLLLGHNPYPDGKPVSGTVKQKCGKWYACIVYEVEQAKELKAVHEAGIDRNAGQITLSDGTRYDLPDTSRLDARRRRYQRMMAHKREAAKRKSGGSKYKPSQRYKRVQLMHQKTQNKIAQIRGNWCHHISRKIADTYSMVYLEKLNVKGMTKSAKGTKSNPGKNVRQKSGLNRVILASCWSKFHQCLDYKTNTCYIDPKYTSQTCSKCGHVAKRNRKTQADFHCTACGHRDNADVNAALNILALGNGATGRGGGDKTAEGSQEHLAARPVKRQIGSTA